MDHMTGKRIVVQRYFYNSPPEKVFSALTDPEMLVNWFLAKATITPKTGTKYTFAWNGGSRHTGKVKRVVRNRLLVLSWPDKVKGKAYLTEARFALTRKVGGTMLELRHSGFKEGDDWVWLYGAIQSGWAYFLMNLKSVLYQGVDLRSKFDDF